MSEMPFGTSVLPSLLVTKILDLVNKFLCTLFLLCKMGIVTIAFSLVIFIP